VALTPIKRGDEGQQFRVRPRC